MRTEKRSIVRVWLEASDVEVSASVRAYGVRNMAKAIGVSPTFLSLWLHGKTAITGDRWAQVRRTLKEAGNG